MTATTNPGDAVVYYGQRPEGWVIQLGEWLREHKNPAAVIRLPDGTIVFPWQFCHAGMAVGTHGETIEALARGVVATEIGTRPHLIIPCPAVVDRDRAVAFMENLVATHARYDFLGFAFMGLDCLTGAHLHWRRKGVYICSEAVAYGWNDGGWPETIQSDLILPGDLAALLDTKETTHG